MIQAQKIYNLISVILLFPNLKFKSNSKTTYYHCRPKTYGTLQNPPLSIWPPVTWNILVGRLLLIVHTQCVLKIRKISATFRKVALFSTKKSRNLVLRLIHGSKISYFSKEVLATHPWISISCLILFFVGLPSKMCLI